MAKVKLCLVLLVLISFFLNRIDTTKASSHNNPGVQGFENVDANQCPTFDACLSCYYYSTEPPPTWGTCPPENTCEPCWPCPSYEPPTTCPEFTCEPCSTLEPCTTTTTSTRYPCTQPTCATYTNVPTTPCPTAPITGVASPKFSKTIYETSLASWPTAGSTIHLGISAETSENDPIIYSLVDPPQFVTLAANQDLIFTTTVAEGAFVGPNNVMVLEVNASVYWDVSLSSAATIVIVFPRNSLKNDLQAQINGEKSIEQCPPLSSCINCYQGFYTPEPYTCPPPYTCTPCEECPLPTTLEPCSQATCPECPTRTPCPSMTTTTWYPCPDITCPTQTTTWPRPTCPTTAPPQGSIPKFSKTLYQTSLASWPTAGTTVHLGISAETSENDPIIYSFINPPQFVTLAANQDVIFTTTVADGAFVGPNNVMVLELNATVYWDTSLSSSAAVIIVFPKSN